MLEAAKEKRRRKEEIVKNFKGTETLTVEAAILRWIGAVKFRGVSLTRTLKIDRGSNRGP